MVVEVIIIIVTYNGMKWLPKCLASIPRHYDIVVIDNCSQDNTVQFIEENYPTAILFKEKENLGFGQANNKGLSYALKQGADYVFLLNQDAYLEETTIENLVKVSIGYPKFGILSPIHTNKEKNRLDKNFANYLSYQNNKQFYSDFVLGNPIAEVYEVPFVNAAGWLLPKKTIEMIGGFDPIFFHYGEDDNYCQRVKYHGLKIGVVTSTIIVHDREERKKKQLNQGDKDFLKKKEIDIKVKFADVNQTDEKIENFYSKVKKNLYKQIILLKRDNIKFYLNYISLLKQTIPEIKESIQKNKKTGSQYIEL